MQFIYRNNLPTPKKKNLQFFNQMYEKLGKKDENTYGVKGISVLSKIKHFNFAEQVPVDPMHCLYGTIKNRMIIMKEKNNQNILKEEEKLNGRFHHYWQYNVFIKLLLLLN